MRKVIFGIAISIDGFIEGPAGQPDWLTMKTILEETAFANKFVSRFDTIFYGRIAYEKFGLAREIDDRQSEAEREFNLSVNTMRKYVFSRKLKHVAGNGMMINGNMVAEVKRLKEEEGKDIWFCGGADILKTFVDLDFIDEYIFAVLPVILGSGKPLFRDMKKRLNLKLVKTKPLKSGVIILNYKPAKPELINQYKNGRSL